MLIIASIILGVCINDGLYSIAKAIALKKTDKTVD